MQYLILAGGFATRLWPLTEKRAKPLLPLGGKPVITHLIEKIPFDAPITVSTNAAYGESFQKWKHDFPNRQITIAVEQTRSDHEKLGALGAVAQWITNEHIDDDIFILTGDNYVGFSFSDFLKHYTPGIPLLAAHDIGSKEEARHFGTVVLHEDNKTVRSFEEKHAEPKTSLVSTGCSIIPKKELPILIEFAKQKPDNIGGIFEEFLRRRIHVHCFSFQEPWFDIGSFDTYLQAIIAVLGPGVEQAPDVHREELHYEGTVVIGAHSHVKRSHLRDTVIFENCIIEDCVLERCVIDNNCILKGMDLSDKMLRDGTRLIARKLRD